MSPIRVAVVDDSPFIRKVLARMLEDESDLDLVGTAARGEELLDHLQEWRADLIVLDLAMPGIGGLATLDAIMAQRPTPVLILSENLRGGAQLAVEALHRGALEVVDKRGLSLVDFEALRKNLVGRIRQLATGELHILPPEEPPAGSTAAPRRPGSSPAIVLLGASTGGPPAIERVLHDLGPQMHVPLVVAQHMPAGFTRAFAARLAAHLALDVREAADGAALEAGRVYVAPGGFHTGVERRRDRFFARLAVTTDRVQPSADRLFTSAAEAAGQHAVAALLTGMGEDGARGMAALAQVGAYTIAQDEATSVVFGMPRAAILAGAAREILPLSLIGGRLRELALPEEETPCNPGKSSSSTIRS
ncbi:MAG TPA: chemotaxis-specific protein-glutamate methyltransferase CheB [Thermoanaerobaculia bacterium]|jgi:two-component system chemotaxis response regulator CheB